MNWLFEQLKPWHKKLIASSLDSFGVLIALPLAFFLRYGQAFPEIAITHQILFQTFTLLVIQTCCFHFYGMYRSIWRYSSTPDLVRLIKAVSIATLLSFSFLFFYNRLEYTPRSIFIINWLLLIIGLGGWRLLYRVVRDYNLSITSGTFDRIIVVGAGSAGEQLIREIKRTPSLNMKAVACIDDDIGKKNKLLHGIPILGTLDQLSHVLKKTAATKVFIAIPSANGEQMNKIVEACQLASVPFKTLPPIQNILNGHVSIQQLRNVEPEDLLGRKQVQLDTLSIENMIKGARVLVTGAGGSIGSELCRQIAQFEPKEIVLFEQTELSLYHLENEFNKKFPHLRHYSVIGDIRSEADVDSAFKTYQPEIVFHAAAYKHVPMMEGNPKASIKTNIFGTYCLSTKAIEYGVTKFVLVSTDKAVNPTNVMGATKRLAEIICENYKDQKTCRFVVVRFGNVLGSSGSVIPRFKQQIKEGGPVTITHPDIERYFMSISEATQLVLQAGALGNGSEIFVLNMGEPVKILNLAEQLIHLSGLEVGKDIKIEYTGLRPGEKLYEELLFDGEQTLPTLHPMLRIAKARSSTLDSKKLIDLLEKTLETSSKDSIKIVLAKVVPEYQPELKSFESTGLKSDDENSTSIH